MNFTKLPWQAEGAMYVATTIKGRAEIRPRPQPGTTEHVKEINMGWQLVLGTKRLGWYSSLGMAMMAAEGLIFAPQPRKELV